MICSNCGRELPDGSVFCNYCGAQQMVQSSSYHGANNCSQGYTDRSDDVVSGYSAYHEPNSNTKPVKEKKKKNPLIVIAAVAGAVFVGQMAGKMMSKSYLDARNSGSKGTSSTVSDTNVPASVPKPDNPEYMKIFSERNIVKGIYMVVMKDTASFAKVDEEGMIDCMDFAYKDDIVSDFQQTLYIDISGTPESDVQALDAEMTGRIENLSGQLLESGVVSYESNIGANYYRISYEVTDLDDPEILKLAKENGLLTTDEEKGKSLSMAATETNMIAQGYVKK